MPGTRYPQMDLNYYLNNREAMHQASTRLLNWAEQSEVAYILFRISTDSDQGCDDVIFCTGNWEIFGEAYLRKSGEEGASGTVYIDVLDNLWLLRARYEERPIPYNTSAWCILHVEDDVLTPAPDELVGVMQDGRAFAQERNQILSRDRTP